MSGRFRRAPRFAGGLPSDCPGLSRWVGGGCNPRRSAARSLKIGAEGGAGRRSIATGGATIFVGDGIRAGV